MSKTQSVAVSKLLLDLENPRLTREVNTQRAAINLMLEIQEDKIVRLAKDIAANGLDPSENLMVYESEEEPGFYIVAEGNRRTTALKLMAQPNLADNERIRKIFSKIKESSTSIIAKISCVIFDDEGYEHWVSLKHTGDNKGVGRERWTTPETDRYKAKHGKISYQRQLYGFVMQQEVEFSEILKNKKTIYATNLSRLFGDKQTMIRFGLSSLDGYLYCSIAFDDFVANFKKVLDVMTYIPPDKKKPEFSVNRIYKSVDREVFLNDLEIPPSPSLLPTAWRLDDLNAKKASPKAEQAEKADTQPDGSASTSAEMPQGAEDSDTDKETKTEEKGRKNTVKKTPKADRNILIPSTLKLNFGGNAKCSKIFSELKNQMRHDTTPFAIAVMLRVFIDLSLTSFIEKKKIVFVDKKQEMRNPGLHDKVTLCCDHLRNAEILTPAQCSAIGAFSKGKLNSSGTIQQYVHNQHLIPSKDIVNTEWDNFQALLEGVWSTSMQA